MTPVRAELLDHPRTTRLANNYMVLGAAVRLAAARQAEFWFDVAGARNLSVKKYETEDEGNSYLKGNLVVHGTLHVQPKGATWSAQFPVSEDLYLIEEPRSGTYAFDVKGKSPVARLLSMALMEYDVENDIVRALGKFEFVPARNKAVLSTPDQAWRWLAEALRKRRLPQENGPPRKVDPKEFSLMQPRPVPARGMRGGPFWQFKHNDTRNYVFIDAGSGEMIVPQSSQPFMRGTFDKYGYAAYGAPRRGQSVVTTRSSYYDDARSGRNIRIPGGVQGKVVAVQRPGMPSAELLDQMGPGAYDEPKYVVKFEGFNPVLVEAYAFGPENIAATSVQKVASVVDNGDIFVSTWGYEQTNVDFYQVVGTTRAMVMLRPIAKQLVRGRGEPTEWVVPVKGQFSGPAVRKKLKTGFRGQPWVNLTSYSGASKWEGKPVAQTGGAYGH